MISTEDSVARHTAMKVIEHMTSNFDCSEFEAAVMTGYIPIIEELIQKGANVNEKRGRAKSTPLHIAVASANKEVIELLFAHGAIITKDMDQTLLTMAVVGHIKGLILERIRLRDTEAAKQSALNDELLRAVEKYSISRIFTLLENGADPNTKNDLGKTTLHIAAQCGYDNVAGLLMEKGADVNARDMAGSTPLHIAASIGHHAVVEVLVQNKANVNAIDVNGLAPLHLAALYGNNAVIKILIRNDANVNSAVQGDGTTPLHCAVASSDIQSVRLLLEAGADPTAENRLKETPMSLALAINREESKSDPRTREIVRLLEEKLKSRNSSSAGPLDQGRKFRMLERLHGSGMELPRHQRNPQRSQLKLVA